MSQFSIPFKILILKLLENSKKMKILIVSDNYEKKMVNEKNTRMMKEQSYSFVP